MTIVYSSFFVISSERSKILSFQRSNLFSVISRERSDREIFSFLCTEKNRMKDYNFYVYILTNWNNKLTRFLASLRNDNSFSLH